MGISLSHARYEEIKQIVVDLFVKYGVSCVPVNGFELATKMGIKIIPYSAISGSKRSLLLKKSQDGFSLEKDIGEWYIFIVLDHSEDSELAEKEVKFFAKYALVPPVLVHKLKLDNPADIAKAFEVSFEAACYAYSYYRKWLKYGGSKYTQYEITLVNLFQGAS